MCLSYFLSKFKACDIERKKPQQDCDIFDEIDDTICHLQTRFDRALAVNISH